MKILQICPYDIDRPGGVQTHILDTAMALRHLGHEVAVLAPGNGRAAEEWTDQGVRILRIGHATRIHFGETGYEISLAWGAERQRLRRVLQEDAFDIAHFHTVWTPWLAPHALRLWRGPAVATFHDTTAATLSGRFLRLVFRLVSRWLLPRFAAVITPSKAPQDSHVPPADKPILIVPPCTDLSRFMAPVQPAVRFTDGKLNLLFLGRLEPRKGAIILLKAFHLLKNDGLALRLIVAGHGSEEAALRAYVAQHALEDVEFVGAPSDTAAWFAAADIFCAPAPQGESFGIVVAEAMASGKPVAAAANAGYSTLLTGEAAAFLTPPGDAVALAGALRRLAADPALRDRLGAWGRKEAERYDCRAWAPRLIEIYRQALSG